MTKILITGATGFIGKFLVSYLLEQNVSVRILVRNHHRKGIFPDCVEQHIGDLINPTHLFGAADGIDVLYHLGGYAHALQENHVTARMHQQVNLMGTKNIFSESIRAGVKKIIFFSSIKAVGESDQCIDETWDKLPSTFYGSAKRAAEKLVLTMGKECGIHVCILRLALVYGPSLKGNLYQMLRAIDKGYFLPIPPINNRRSLVSVYDVCQAAWLATQRENANGKIYFVTDKKSYSTYDIYLLIRKALGYSNPSWYIPLWIFKLLALLGSKAEYLIQRNLPFNFEKFNKLFGTSYFSSASIQKELGFDAQYSFENLLPQIVHSYRTEQA